EDSEDAWAPASGGDLSNRVDDSVDHDPALFLEPTVGVEAMLAPFRSSRDRGGQIDPDPAAVHGIPPESVGELSGRVPVERHHEPHAFRTLRDLLGGHPPGAGARTVGL